MTSESELLASVARQRLAGPLGGRRSLWSEAGSLGWSGIGVSENEGGSGGTIGDLLVVLREHGYASVSLPLPEQSIGCQLLATAGGGPALLRDCISGATAVTVAPTASLATDGSIHMAAVPWASDADLVVAVLDAPSNELLAVKLEPSRVIHGANLAGEERSSVTAVYSSDVIDRWELDESDADLLTRLGAAARAAQIAGAARRTLEMTVEYASERRQFGRPIASFQAVAHHLARMSELCTAADASIDLLGGSPLDQDVVAAAKIWAGRTAVEVARLAHQVHGAIGVTKEHPLHASTLRLRAWDREFGTPEHWAQALGAHVAEDPESWWLRSPGEDPVR